MKLWPIFIPSKGRPHSKLVEASVGGAHVVVEPQERAAYHQKNPAALLVELPASGQGIAFARNFILDVNRRQGADWFWMLDDDISAFHLNTIGKKPRRITAMEALSAAQEVVLGSQRLSEVGEVALEYQQFAWSGRQPHRFNSYCDVAVAVNVGATRRLSYRPEMTLKEDRDFTLQVLSAGRMTLRLGRIGFTTPKNGANAGGLSKVYAEAGREEMAVKNMVAVWPALCARQVKKDGRVDVKIKWSHFK